MKELDVLLDAYARAHFVAASPAEQSHFLLLLESPDPDLVRYLLGGELPDEAELAGAVQAVLAHAGIMSFRNHLTR
jgi:succinate dehydrogenase flavin-adding protein (antitoxin of CptAB toxin-antitoxin module)